MCKKKRQTKKKKTPENWKRATFSPTSSAAAGLKAFTCRATGGADSQPGCRLEDMKAVWMQLRWRSAAARLSVKTVCHHLRLHIPAGRRSNGSVCIPFSRLSCSCGGNVCVCVCVSTQVYHAVRGLRRSLCARVGFKTLSQAIG